MLRVDRVEMEEVQRVFSKKLLDPTPSPSYRERYELLHLDPLWLPRVKRNLTLLFSRKHTRLENSPDPAVGFLAHSRIHRCILECHFPKHLLGQNSSRIFALACGIGHRTMSDPVRI